MSRAIPGTTRIVRQPQAGRRRVFVAATAGRASPDAVWEAAATARRSRGISRRRGRLRPADVRPATALSGSGSTSGDPEAIHVCTSRRTRHLPTAFRHRCRCSRMFAAAPSHGREPARPRGQTQTASPELIADRSTRMVDWSEAPARQPLDPEYWSRIRRRAHRIVVAVTDRGRPPGQPQQIAHQPANGEPELQRTPAGRLSRTAFFPARPAPARPGRGRR